MEIVPGSHVEHRLPHGVVNSLRKGLQLSHDTIFRGFQYTVKPSQNSKGKDNFAVFGLFETTSKYLGNAPNKAYAFVEILHDVDVSQVVGSQYTLSISSLE